MSDGRTELEVPPSNNGHAVTLSFITPTRQFDPENVRRIQTMLPKGHELIVVTCPGGAAHAKNIGASVATGDVLVFVDDDVHLMADWDWDDWLRRDWHFAIAEQYWPSPPINTFMMRAQAMLLNVLTNVFRYKMFMTGFAAVRRPVFEAVGGYNESVVFEEHAITLDFYRRRFRGARLPVRVRVQRRWMGFSPSNGTTSRGKDHPDPKPGEVVVLETGPPNGAPAVAAPEVPRSYVFAALPRPGGGLFDSE